MINIKKLLKFLIFAAILQIPFYFLFKFKFLRIPLNNVEITIFLILILYLYFLIFIQKSQIILKTQELFQREELLPFILILAGLLLSLINAQNKLAVLGILKSWFLIPFVFAFIVSDIFKQGKQNILLYIFSSTFIVSFIALLYWLFKNLTYDGRLAAFYNSPNYLAMYLAPGFLIGIFLAYKNRKKIKIALLVSIISLTLLWALILTKSAGLFAAMFIAVFFTFVFYLLTQPIKKSGDLNQTNREKKEISPLVAFQKIKFVFLNEANRKKLFYILITLLLLLGLVTPIILGNNKDRIISAPNLKYKYSSIYSRLIIWEVSSSLIRKNWLFGLGAGNFQKAYLDFQKDYQQQFLDWSVPHPHNILLYFWLGSGLLGLFGFSLLIILKFKKIYKERKNDFYGILFLVLILYILFHGFVDTTYWKNDLALIFWLIIFLI